MRVIYFLFILFSCQLLTAQNPLRLNSKSDSLSQVTLPDTLNLPDSLKLNGMLAGKKKKKRKVRDGIKDLFNFKKDYPNPKKAVLLTAVFPGTGQIYNKKYWKLPIVYGAVGGLVYGVIFNTGQQRRFQKALEDRLDGDPCTIDEFTQVTADKVVVRESLDENSIRSLRNQHRKWKELSYIGVAFAYILTGVDAYVDAHLMNFNVNDDLTLQVRPDFKVLPDWDTSVGIGLGLRLRDKRDVELPVDLYLVDGK